jgi:hypothetical protein
MRQPWKRSTWVAGERHRRAITVDPDERARGLDRRAVDERPGIRQRKRLHVLEQTDRRARDHETIQTEPHRHQIAAVQVDKVAG